MSDPQDTYQQYLKSPHWQRTRARILERADEHCEWCGRFCGRDPHCGTGPCDADDCTYCREYFTEAGANDLERQGLEVHHRTYERRGRERDSDLVALCWACHEGTWDTDRWPL